MKRFDPAEWASSLTAKLEERGIDLEQIKKDRHWCGVPLDKIYIAPGGRIFLDDAC